jgi:hypothetical protein
MTLYDQQTGKLVTGTPVNITQHTFELVDEYGNYLGRFPLDNWPKECNATLTVAQKDL